MRRSSPTRRFRVGLPPLRNTATGESKVTVTITFSPATYAVPSEGSEVILTSAMRGRIAKTARLATSAGSRHDGRSMVTSGLSPPVTLREWGVNHLRVVIWSTPASVPPRST